MRIGIELMQIFPHITGGIAPLLQNLFGHLLPRDQRHTYHVFRHEANAGMFAWDYPHVHLHQLPVDSVPYFDALAIQARSLRLDIVFRSYPLDVPFDYPADRQVVLIPDLQHDFFPEFFEPTILERRRNGFRQVLAEAGAIGTISEHARGTILDHPANRCRDVFLMPPALNGPQACLEERLLSREEHALLPTVPYFFFPGNLWPHKNHRRVLVAFQSFLAASGAKAEFLFSGHPDGWDKLKADFPDLPARHLGFVRKEFLQFVLRRSRALVFFTLFEGFGIPLLEAFDAGTPVICSNTTSLPEVGGDAVLMCDPTDVAAMADLMGRVFRDEELRHRLIGAGKPRVHRYSWEESANQLVAACERTVARAGPLRKIGWKKSCKIYVKEKMPKIARVLRAFRHPRRILLPSIGAPIAGAWNAMLHAIWLDAPVARFQARMKQRLKARLGFHYQYPPQELRVSDAGRARLPKTIPTISIVTPSYNQGEFLERTIRSVLSQGYPKLEYIVQDGGSKDRSGAILEQFRERLCHCESRPDNGQTHAINLGFRHASGDVLAYLNSDDLLMPGALAYVARYFHDHPKIDVIYGHRIIINEDDMEVGRWLLPAHDDEVLTLADYVPQETLFWRREIWQRVGGSLDESFQFAMDWDLLLRFHKAGARFARVPRYLGAFRVHSRQKTQARLVDLGVPEVERLLLRSHGRVVGAAEIAARTKRYLRKHVLLRLFHRMKASV